MIIATENAMKQLKPLHTPKNMLKFIILKVNIDTTKGKTNKWDLFVCLNTLSFVMFVSSKMGMYMNVSATKIASRKSLHKLRKVSAVFIGSTVKISTNDSIEVILIGGSIVS